MHFTALIITAMHLNLKKKYSIIYRIYYEARVGTFDVGQRKDSAP